MVSSLTAEAPGPETPGGAEASCLKVRVSLSTGRCVLMVPSCGLRPIGPQGTTGAGPAAGTEGGVRASTGRRVKAPETQTQASRAAPPPGDRPGLLQSSLNGGPWPGADSSQAAPDRGAEPGLSWNRGPQPWPGLVSPLCHRKSLFKAQQLFPFYKHGLWFQGGCREAQ